MKTILLSLAILTAGNVLTTSCTAELVRKVARGDRSIKGSQTFTTVKHDLAASPFAEVSSPATFDMMFYPTQGAMRIEVETSDNLQQYVSVKVNDGRLTVKWDTDHNVNAPKAIVRIYAPALHYIELSGTGDFRVKGAYRTDALTIHSSGTGNFKSEALIAAQTLQLTNTGTGDVTIDGLKLSGDAKFLNSGTGDNTIRNLEAQRVSITNSGTGDDTLTGKAQAVSVSCTGTGDVNINGLLRTELDVTARGTGDVVR